MKKDHIVQGTSILGSMDYRLSTSGNHDITLEGYHDITLEEPSKGTLLNIYTIKDKL